MYEICVKCETVRRNGFHCRSYLSRLSYRIVGNERLFLLAAVTDGAKYGSVIIKRYKSDVREIFLGLSVSVNISSPSYGICVYNIVYIAEFVFDIFLHFQIDCRVDFIPAFVDPFYCLGLVDIVKFAEIVDSLIIHGIDSPRGDLLLILKILRGVFGMGREVFLRIGEDKFFVETLLVFIVCDGAVFVYLPENVLLTLLVVCPSVKSHNARFIVLDSHIGTVSVRALRYRRERRGFGCIKFADIFSEISDRGKFYSVDCASEPDIVQVFFEYLIF